MKGSRRAVKTGLTWSQFRLSPWLGLLGKVSWTDWRPYFHSHWNALCYVSRILFAPCLKSLGPNVMIWVGFAWVSFEPTRKKRDLNLFPSSRLPWVFERILREDFYNPKIYLFFPHSNRDFIDTEYVVYIHCKGVHTIYFKEKTKERKKTCEAF